MQRGMEAVWNEAMSIVQNQTSGFGISLDLDVLDPLEEPGVGSPESGVSSQKQTGGLFSTLKTNPNFLAMEIVEDNPYLATQFVMPVPFAI